MRKINYHVIWVVGLFLLLVVILAMVMTYKIRYEDSIYYKYLYFYDCNNDLCSSNSDKEIEDKSDIYSVYKYRDNTPTFIKLDNDYVEILDNGKNVLYDYVRGERITVNYKDYKVIDNENILFIASNEDGKCGIIDKEGKVLLDFSYDLIKESYNEDMIVTKLGEKYGIIRFDNLELVLKYEYDDIYIFDDVIVSIKDNVLNILNTNLEKFTNNISVSDVSKVSINLDGEILNIKIDNENDFSEYKFNIKTKKMV